MAGEKRTLSFGITGEFITQITREWFYSGEKSIGKIMEILKSSMTGTDTPEAQIERFAEDILIGRAALKGSTDEGTYHLETYDPGEEERLLTNTDIWRLPQLLKDSRRKCDRMQERFLIAMEHLSERTKRSEEGTWRRNRRRSVGVKPLQIHRSDDGQRGAHDWRLRMA